MKAISLVLTALLWASTASAAYDWPLGNDSEFKADVVQPRHAAGTGPSILVDGFHQNVFVEEGFIEPFLAVARADGFKVSVGKQSLDQTDLDPVDLVVIITALPFEFGTKTEVTDESTFSPSEIERLYEWVSAGGSLLVFSEHAPFDQAINPLLARFDIESSVGYVIDEQHQNPTGGKPAWIVYSRENGLLNPDHPITQGRSAAEQITALSTYGGSSLSGKNYVRLLTLAPTAVNTVHPTGVGPVGMGDSQALAGRVGRGKVVALGDSNGFVAMKIKATGVRLGMNAEGYDWKQFVLNTLRWLTDETAADIGTAPSGH
ncbi:MAG: DUF4350 domain-containing protein [Lysobacterales bacterium]